jgi:hypothetical protein
MALNAKQLEIIAYLTAEASTLKEALDVCNVAKSTYYDWKRKPEFNETLKEFQEAKKQAEIDFIKDSVDKYLERIDRLSDKSANDMVKLQASNKMLEIAGLGVDNEGNNKKDESGYKNFLKDMLKVKKKSG